MKKITEESVKNFLARNPYKNANMLISMEGSICYMRLFGNKIAAMEADGSIWISAARWFSATTKERLNAIPNVKIVQKKWLWYLNGTLWDGKPTYIYKADNPV